MKHQWLYLNALDTVSSLKRFVRFYVEHPSMGKKRIAFWSAERLSDERVENLVAYLMLAEPPDCAAGP